MSFLKLPTHSKLNWAILLCDVIRDGKNWVNCAVLTGNSAGLSELPFPVVFHTENCAVHSGNPTVSSVYLSTPRLHILKALNLPSHDIFLFKYFLLHNLSFLFFFSDNIMADVASKHQTTALFYPPQSHAQEDTRNCQKELTNLMGNLCCAIEH
jgi:hypothetical protein